MGFSLKKIVKGVTQAATGDWLGLAGTVAGGVLGSSGAKKAGNAQAAGNQAGINPLQNQLTNTTNLYNPYTSAGTNALTALQNPSESFQSSPGYQFARNEALDAVKTQQNSLGRLASGNTLAALQDRATGIAQQDYNNWWGQQSGLANMGLGATNSLAGYGSNTANNIAGLQSGIGSAKAGGIQGATNSWQNALSDASGFLGHMTGGDNLQPYDLGAIRSKKIGNRLSYSG